MVYYVSKAPAKGSGAETWLVSHGRGKDAPAYPEACAFCEEDGWDEYRFDSYAEAEEYMAQDESQGAGWKEII